jgi:hypothetical protein
MKKIIIEISESQHQLMMEHIQRGHKINFEEETFSGFTIKLSTCEFGASLVLDMYGTIDLGDVNWEIK